MSDPKKTSREVLKGTWQEQHSYSLGVKTAGRTTIYLAGVGAWEDDSGKSLAGDFDGQVRACFEQIRRNLEKVGATLDDIASMTVFITDMKNRPRFIEIRKEFFTNGFPASALIGINELARPPMIVEIQAVAVID